MAAKIGSSSLFDFSIYRYIEEYCRVSTTDWVGASRGDTNLRFSFVVEYYGEGANASVGVAASTATLEYQMPASVFGLGLIDFVLI